MLYDIYNIGHDLIRYKDKKYLKKVQRLASAYYAAKTQIVL